MKIINLALAPEHIPTIAAWHHAQWGYLNPGGTLESRIEKMQRYLKGAAMPAMYICVDGRAVIGTAALVENDMDSHPELSPWLASVYVDPDYRRRGIGAALVKRVVSEAKALGHSPLYLFTPDREEFYRQLGWQFIARQKIFFVGTATDDSRVNISPKGMDSLRVLDSNRVIWLNVTGSGNETAAHLQTHPRMTIMFAAFEGAPMILRLYGSARTINHGDPEWSEYYRHFPANPGARQVFEMSVDLVQTSCGMAVPFFNYVEEREQLNNWAANKGEEGIKAYWQEKNRLSLDGAPIEAPAH